MRGRKELSEHLLSVKSRMGQILEIEKISNSDILEYFRCRIDSLSGSSVKEYYKAFIYLTNFVSGNGDTLVRPTVSLIEDWCYFLFNAGMTVKTVTHYIDILSALYSAAVSEGLLQPTDVFKAVKAKVKSGTQSRPLKTLTEDEYLRLHNLACISPKLPVELAMYIDIFVISILTGCRSFLDIAMLKKSDISSHSSQVATLLERYCENNRKYVFPLSQSVKTPRQLERSLEDKIVPLLSSRGIRMFGSLVETARCYWAYAAMKCGLTPSDIHSFFGKYPVAIPVGKINANSSCGTSDRDTLIRTVGAAFLHNPLNWHAMKLRPRVSIDDIERRVRQFGKECILPEMFYPSREIAKRIGKKTLLKEQPVIPDIVFFKSRITDIYPLFLKIGDLAWCYRAGNGTGPYAVIARESMERFQRAVGRFTSDYEVGPIGTITPMPGDTVKVLDGLFAGSTGELLKIENMNEAGVIYRLRIVDGQGVEWKVGVDSRQTRTIDKDR